jgi:tetratricopeptide (TPR) repeat protein
MRTFPDLRMRDLVWDAQRAQQLLDQNSYQEAKELFGSVRARARKLGVDSSYLAWGLAVVHDFLGELEVAFEAIGEAVTHDPMNVAVHRSFDLIAGRLRAALAEAKRAPDDPSTPQLYALLQGAGEADVPCHLAMARHLAHAGKHAEAMRVLDAITLLSPVSKDAWEAKAGLARVMGDPTLAATCDAEAAAVAAAQVPFGVPAPRGAAC